jgi:uncharacterized protein with PIN domain
MLILRFAEELRFLLPARHRGGVVELRPDTTSTLGHYVQAAGVPLTEVGELRAGDVVLPASHRAAGGAVVDVLPVLRPQPTPTTPPRFLLDVHLGRLARRLRILGLDAAYRNDAGDRELADAGVREDRVLLTQDRGLLRRRSSGCAAYVRGAGTEEQLRDVLDRFAPPLEHWTRCPTCNGMLAAVPKRDVLPVLKPGTARSYDSFVRCRSCGQVYWRGAHAHRLDQLVSEAAREASAEAVIRPPEPG